QKVCNAAARELRNRLNALFAKNDWPLAAYGDFSMVKLVPNYDGPRPGPSTTENDGLIPHGGNLQKLDGAKNMKPIHALRQALLLNGVDWWGLAGMTSAAHTPEVVDRTVKAF